MSNFKCYIILYMADNNGGLCMAEMKSRERFARMFEHREADRVPIMDFPWQGTVKRWHRKECRKE